MNFDKHSADFNDDHHDGSKLESNYNIDFDINKLTSIYKIIIINKKTEFYNILKQIYQDYLSQKE